MLELRAINKDNWYECTQLTITDEQRQLFPFPPVFWLAECKYKPDWHELAIYNDSCVPGKTTCEARRTGSVPRRGPHIGNLGNQSLR